MKKDTKLKKLKKTFFNCIRAISKANSHNALLLTAKPSKKHVDASPPRFSRPLETIAIVIALITLIAQLLVSLLQYNEWQEESKARHEERSARAWQILTTNAPGNSGKVEALEFLARNNVPLTDIDLSCKSNDGLWLEDRNFCEAGRVYLRNLDLSMQNIGYRVNLKGANFSGADLTGAAFDGAILNDAIFNGAILEGVSFRDTLLLATSFDGIVTSRGAGSFDIPLLDDNGDVFLSSQSVRGTDFTGAFLSSNSFREADLYKAKFDGAIVGADFSQARLTLANFEGVEFWMPEFHEMFDHSWVWSNTLNSELPRFSNSTINPRHFLLFCHTWDSIPYIEFETDFPDKYQCKKWEDWSERERKTFLFLNGSLDNDQLDGT